ERGESEQIGYEVRVVGVEMGVPGLGEIVEVDAAGEGEGLPLDPPVVDEVGIQVPEMSRAEGEDRERQDRGRIPETPPQGLGSLGQRRAGWAKRAREEATDDAGGERRGERGKPPGQAQEGEAEEHDVEEQAPGEAGDRALQPSPPGG